MKLTIIVLSLLVSFLVACAPATTPPTPAPIAPATPQPAIAPAQASPSPEEASWAKLVEAAKKEKEVTIYSYALVGDSGVALSKAFKDRYGITVSIITGRGAELAERLKTEQRLKQVVVDAVETAPTHLIQMKNAGFSLNISDIPVLKEKNVWLIDPLSTDPQGHMLLVFPAHYPPVINTNLIKPADEPKSYMDLLDPKWKGKIVENDPVLANAAYLIYVPLVSHKVLDDEYFRKLGDQNIQFVRGETEKAEKISRGEFPVSLMGSESTFPAFAAEGAPIKPLALKEGTPVGGDGMIAITNSPHPNAAKLFINWILSAEGSTLLAKTKSQMSLRKDVTDYRPPTYAVKAIKLVPLTAEDWEMTTKLFNEKYLVKLYKK